LDTAETLEYSCEFQPRTFVKLSAARSELDSMVVEIELTLTSIAQGVALYFLIDNARAVLSLQQRAFWPYIISGLLTILIFWSRSVVHTLTLIRWPIEFGHNFFYIACALGESLLFSRLSNPRAWFAFGACYAVIAWLLFIYDLRLLYARERDSAGETSNQLYGLITRDQWLNIVALVPGLVLLNASCAVLVRIYPEFFIARNGHAWLALIQLLASAIYLLYVLRFFKTLIPLVSRAREEWRTSDNMPG
jgi:hypothetical protein